MTGPIFLIPDTPETERQAADVAQGKIADPLRKYEQSHEAYGEVAEADFAPAEKPEELGGGRGQNTVASAILNYAAYFVGSRIVDIERFLNEQITYV